MKMNEGEKEKVLLKFMDVSQSSSGYHWLTIVESMHQNENL